MAGPFGNQRQVFTNLVSNVYQFTGDEYDSGSGYNYAVARFEAGRWSRFLSPDPYLGSMDLSNPQSLNRYAYVMNSPTSITDPLGLSWVYIEQQFCVDSGDGDHCTIEGDWVWFDDAFGGPTFGGGGGGGASGNSSTNNENPQKPVSCKTPLPNGQTVGDVVRQQRAAISSVTVAGTNIDNLPTIERLGTFASIARPGGPIDFKNNFKGQGDPTVLGSEGNFAYYQLAQVTYRRLP